MPTLKELMKSQLDTLKKMGKDRRTIERDLGYSENYLNQALSMGGNEKIYEALIAYQEKFELGEEESPYKKFNIVASQQQTIDRISRLLESESLRNQQLEKKVEELQNKFADSSQTKQHRRSA